MLRQFLIDNRHELIRRCRGKVAQRAVGTSTGPQEQGIAAFLGELIASLPPARPPGVPETRRSATRHGAELLRQHLTIDEVVHSYGDLCQAITQLAVEKGADIEVAEFGLLNKALDDAIADAVTEFCSGSSARVAERDMLAETERRGHFAHELRNQLHTATLALAAVKTGNVGLYGATGALLERTMADLRALVERSLMEVRARSPLRPPLVRLAVADLVAEAAAAAELEARAAGCTLTVEAVDPELAVLGDREMLMSAIGNLLQNAFKFSHKRGEVSLHAHARGERVLVEVADACGGLPAGIAEKIFRPFVQAGENRSGLGLGLASARRGVEANDGVLSVRDAPPTGCVFTIDLPRHARDGYVPQRTDEIGPQAQRRTLSVNPSPGAP